MTIGKAVYRKALATPGLLNILTAPPSLMAEDGAFSHNIDHVMIFKEILNLGGVGHPNRLTGLKVTAISING